MTLNDLLVDGKGVIIALEMEDALARRMYGMGFVVGKTIEVIRRTKKTLHVRVGSTDYVIRDSNAKEIIIK